jgi:hypothetical protein
MNTNYRDHFFRHWIEDRFPNAEQREFCLADIEEAFNLAFRLGYVDAMRAGRTNESNSQGQTPE